MQGVEKAVRDYLDAVETVHGSAFREAVKVRHTGGANVVIEFPDGKRTLVGLDRLNMMTRLLLRQEMKKAA